MDKEVVLSNIGKIHTTTMGEKRIKRNLKTDNLDVTKYCKEMILDEKSVINKKGKNYYCKNNNIILTINSSSYTIITAHVIE